MEGKRDPEDLRENNDWVLRLPIADRDWSTCSFFLGYFQDTRKVIYSILEPMPLALALSLENPNVSDKNRTY